MGNLPLRQSIVGILCSLTLFTAPSSADNSESSENEKIKQFVQSMVDEHGFSAEYVESVLAKAQKNESILEAIARPWEAKPWHQYYPIFLTDKRLAKGLEFWQTHQDALTKAEKEIGVPAQIIVAIIGVETFYGTYKGKYSVLDALYTLGFYYPPRSKFFKSELEQLFLLSKEEGFEPSELLGSYAGAMGWGQFISSSYRHYAVDFDQDGVRDLLNNPVDAIGSVANYFKRHGWRNGEAVAFPVTVESEQDIQDFLGKDLTYKHQWNDLQGKGIILPDGIQLDQQQSVRLFAFEQTEGREYWLGLPNFYTITRYNHSPLYAMAVYQFSEQLRQARGKL